MSFQPVLPRPKSWWDTFDIPPEIATGHPDALRGFLELVTPLPMEHDFVLYTDGSGCTAGWGAYAALIEEVIGDCEQPRWVSSRDVRFAATYGSTVQRSELTALLEGLHAILYRAVARSAADDVPVTMADLVGPQRVSVCWFTDRLNIARALLFDQRGSPLDSRAKDRDLWLRFSAFARHACITPRPMPRNDVGLQERMDKVCGIARSALKDAQPLFGGALENTIDPQSWTNPKPQRALF